MKENIIGSVISGHLGPPLFDCLFSEIDDRAATIVPDAHRLLALGIGAHRHWLGTGRQHPDGKQHGENRGENERQRNRKQRKAGKSDDTDEDDKQRLDILHGEKPFPATNVAVDVMLCKRSVAFCCLAVFNVTGAAGPGETDAVMSELRRAFKRREGRMHAGGLACADLLPNLDNPRGTSLPKMEKPRATRAAGLSIEGFGSGQARRMTRAISETAKSTRNRKNRTWAIDAEAPAMPPKPRTPAMMATTRNTSA
jgi:hypothetical protein